jgi:hypothetical protein
MNGGRFFTPEAPPKSGKALRLWNWWIRYWGEPPQELHVQRPGWFQRNSGAANYVIVWRRRHYLCLDVDQAITEDPRKAKPDHVFDYWV